MNYEDAAKFKKGRDAARNALSKAVNELCNKYELNRFEVLHAIVDKSVTEVENQAQNYPGMFPLTITNGLAETYHQHTLGLAERAYAQAAADPEPAGPPKKGGLKGLFTKGPKPSITWEDPVPWSWTDVDGPQSANVTEAQLKAAAKSQKFSELYGLKYTPVAPTKNYNMSSGKLTEYIPLKPTLKVADWDDMAYNPTVALGGTIAKSTVEQYGYELPEGYKFQDTVWGDYVVVKDTKHTPETYVIKNTDGVTVEVPFNTWLSKSEATAYGVWSLNLPPGLQWAGPGPQKEGMGSWALIYKGADWPATGVDLDEHLAEYTEKYPAYGHACGTKGCLDVTLNPGEHKTFSGAYLAGLGLKKNTIAVSFPDALEVEYVANMDLVKVSYPV